ncbi:hypothetical protein D3C86_2000880 [compost metagenome]
MAPQFLQAGVLEALLYDPNYPTSQQLCTFVRGGAIVQKLRQIMDARRLAEDIGNISEQILDLVLSPLGLLCNQSSGLSVKRQNF